MYAEENRNVNVFRENTDKVQDLIPKYNDSPWKNIGRDGLSSYLSGSLAIIRVA